MKFYCDNCGAKYLISDDKVRGKILRIRCKKCDHIVVVQEPSAPVAGASRSLSELQQKLRSTGGGQQQVAARAAVPPPAPAAPVTSVPWYYSVAGQSFGPMAFAALRSKFESGQLGDEAYVWNKTMTDWIPAKETRELKSVFQLGKGRRPRNPTITLSAADIRNAREDQRPVSRSAAPAPSPSRIRPVSNPVRTKSSATPAAMTKAPAPAPSRPLSASRILKRASRNRGEGSGTPILSRAASTPLSSDSMPAVATASAGAASVAEARRIGQGTPEERLQALRDKLRPSATKSKQSSLRERLKAVARKAEEVHKETPEPEALPESIDQALTAEAPSNDLPGVVPAPTPVNLTPVPSLNAPLGLSPEAGAVEDAGPDLAEALAEASQDVVEEDKEPSADTLAAAIVAEAVAEPEAVAEAEEAAPEPVEETPEAVEEAALEVVEEAAPIVEEAPEPEAAQPEAIAEAPEETATEAVEVAESAAPEISAEAQPEPDPDATKIDLTIPSELLEDEAPEEAPKESIEETAPETVEETPEVVEEAKAAEAPASEDLEVASIDLPEEDAAVEEKPEEVVVAEAPAPEKVEEKEKAEAKPMFPPAEPVAPIAKGGLRPMSATTKEKFSKEPNDGQEMSHSLLIQLSDIKKGQRRRAWMWVAAVLVVLLCGAVAWFVATTMLSDKDKSIGAQLQKQVEAKKAESAKKEKEAPDLEKPKTYSPDKLKEITEIDLGEDTTPVSGDEKAEGDEKGDDKGVSKGDPKAVAKGAGKGAKGQDKKETTGGLSSVKMDGLLNPKKGNGLDKALDTASKGEVDDGGLRRRDVEGTGAIAKADPLDGPKIDKDMPSSLDALRGVKNTKIEGRERDKGVEAEVESAPMLTREQLNRGFISIRNSVSQCVEKQTKRSGLAMERSKVRITITIMNSGQVSDVSMDGGLGNSIFGNCMKSRKARWKFPAFSGNPMKVKRAFVIQ